MRYRKRTKDKVYSVRFTHNFSDRDLAITVACIIGVPLYAALPVELASETGHPCPLAEAIQPDPGRLVPRVGGTTGKLTLVYVYYLPCQC